MLSAGTLGHAGLVQKSRDGFGGPSELRGGRVDAGARVGGRLRGRWISWPSIHGHPRAEVTPAASYPSRHTCTREEALLRELKVESERYAYGRGTKMASEAVNEYGRGTFVEKPTKAVPIALINLTDYGEIETVAAAMWLGSMVSGSVPDNGEIAEALAARGIEPDSAHVAAVERFLRGKNGTRS